MREACRGLQAPSRGSFELARPGRGRRSRGSAARHCRDARAVDNRRHRRPNRVVRELLCGVAGGEGGEGAKVPAPRRRVTHARIRRPCRWLRRRRPGRLVFE